MVRIYLMPRATVAAILPSALLVLGACGPLEDLTPCEQAADHVAQCTGQAARSLSGCDSAAAEAVLTQDCSVINAARANGKADFGDFWEKMVTGICQYTDLFCKTKDPWCLRYDRYQTHFGWCRDGTSEMSMFGNCVDPGQGWHYCDDEQRLPVDRCDGDPCPAGFTCGTVQVHCGGAAICPDAGYYVAAYCDA